MNYQAAASECQAAQLAKEQSEVLPAAATYNLDSFDFNYLNLNDSDTLKVGDSLNNFYLSISSKKFIAKLTCVILFYF